MGSHTLIFCVIFDVYKCQSIVRVERYGFTIISVPNDLHDSIIKQIKHHQIIHGIFAVNITIQKTKYLF